MRLRAADDLSAIGCHFWSARPAPCTHMGAEDDSIRLVELYKRQSSTNGRAHLVGLWGLGWLNLTGGRSIANRGAACFFGIAFLQAGLRCVNRLRGLSLCSGCAIWTSGCAPACRFLHAEALDTGAQRQINECFPRCAPRAFDYAENTRTGSGKRGAPLLELSMTVL